MFRWLNERISRRVDRDFVDVEAAILSLRAAVDADPETPHVDEQRRVLEAGIALEENTLRLDRRTPYVIGFGFVAFAATVVAIYPPRSWPIFAVWAWSFYVYGSVAQRRRDRIARCRRNIENRREILRRFYGVDDA